MSLQTDVTFPAEVLAVPPDLADALEAEPVALRFFEGLSYGRQKAFAVSVTSAKRAETRRRRVARTVTMLKEGRNR
jgi:uncharacterized protein YdeI (YjbR/CyaY-like superfamily)